jgi:hypothetical protein
MELSTKMPGMRSKTTWLTAIAALPLLLALGLAVWQVMYPGPYDDKSLRYRAWKIGIPLLTQDQGLETMVIDPHRNDLVIGKTEVQLAKRFGYVTPMDHASDYVQYCFKNSPYWGREAIVLRNSAWMVLMKNSRAYDLVPAKGC